MLEKLQSSTAMCTTTQQTTTDAAAQVWRGMAAGLGASKSNSTVGLRGKHDAHLHSAGTAADRLFPVSLLQGQITLPHFYQIPVMPEVTQDIADQS